MPLGTRIHAKAVPEARSFSTGFWHPRHLVLVPFRGGFWEPKSAKKGEKADPEFGRDFDRKRGTADAQKRCCPPLCAWRRGGLLEGDKNMARTWKNRARRQELERTWKKELEDPGRLIQHALLLG